jgi:hypothetical protein
VQKELTDPIQETKKSFNLSLRDIQQILTNLEQCKNISVRDSCIIVVAIEFLKCVNNQEFRNMVAYYNENNKHFASNAPERYTFRKILSKLRGPVSGDLLELSDNAFYDYAKEYL